MSLMTVLELLGRSELFAELPTMVLNAVADICREVKVSKGEIVFRIGDPSKNVFILAEGSVELGYGLISPQESKTGTIREPGEFFGWGALAGDGNYRLINAVAVQETRLIIVDGLALMNLLEGQPASGFRFVRKLLVIVLNRIVTMAAT
jgi:CRP-like cAMP-binding protein